jgi:hypothetical protein
MAVESLLQRSRIALAAAVTGVSAAAAPKRALPVPSPCDMRFPCAEKMIKHSTHPQNILLAIVSEAPYAGLVLVTARLHRWNYNFGALALDPV